LICIACAFALTKKTGIPNFFGKTKLVSVYLFWEKCLVETKTQGTEIAIGPMAFNPSSRRRKRYQASAKVNSKAWHKSSKLNSDGMRLGEDKLSSVGWTVSRSTRLGDER